MPRTEVEQSGQRHGGTSATGPWPTACTGAKRPADARAADRVTHCAGGVCLAGCSGDCPDFPWCYRNSIDLGTSHEALSQHNAFVVSAATPSTLLPTPGRHATRPEPTAGPILEMQRAALGKNDGSRDRKPRPTPPVSRDCATSQGEKRTEHLLEACPPGCPVRRRRCAPPPLTCRAADAHAPSGHT